MSYFHFFCYHFCVWLDGSVFLMLYSQLLKLLIFFNFNLNVFYFSMHTLSLPSCMEMMIFFFLDYSHVKITLSSWFETVFCHCVLSFLYNALIFLLIWVFLTCYNTIWSDKFFFSHFWQYSIKISLIKLLDHVLTIFFYPY